ncbi:MAG: Multiple EGF-like-domain protein 3 precursor, partial [Myxococcaceae bacterium]|nr:Multiple EGF-like-domain protein 3 precursor [Myxococcaceae bacterium]
GCASAGPDAIYKIVAPISGQLRADVPAAGFNVSLGARSTCPTSTTASLPIVCANASSAGGLEEISLSVVQGQTYYLIVDGAGATDKGAFTMLVTVSPPGCGDGLVAGVEQCDDGNSVAGDGCSSTCTFEPLAGIDTCPGHALTLSGIGADPRVGALTVNTAPLAANYGGSCGGNSKEGVVVVTPPISGTLTAKLTGIDYQPVLYVRSTCIEPTTQLACASDAPTPSSFTRNVTFTVLAGTPYYLFVDGYNGGAGTARLNVTVTP